MSDHGSASKRALTLQPVVPLDAAFDLASLAELLRAAHLAFGSDPAAAHRLVMRAASLVEAQKNHRAGDAVRIVRSGRLTEWQVARLREYIDAHLPETIRVSELARTARLNTNYFSRLFRRTLGQSPYAYVMARRAARAAEMMLDGNTSLSEIAQNCGFADQAHFSRVYRRIMGQSPSVWRRERTQVHADTTRFFSTKDRSCKTAARSALIVAPRSNTRAREIDQ